MIKEIVPYLMVILVVILIRLFVITPVIVEGKSMTYTLDEDEVLLLSKFDRRYTYGDIVVIEREEEKDLIIKRVIALPGDTISCINGVVYVNNEPIEEDYKKGITFDFLEVKVPKNHYFVMGDNRMGSDDSRRMGPIHKNNIKGTVKLRIYPFNEFGFVE